MAGRFTSPPRPQGIPVASHDLRAEPRSQSGRHRRHRPPAAARRIVGACRGRCRSHLRRPRAGLPFPPGKGSRRGAVRGRFARTGRIMARLPAGQQPRSGGPTRRCRPRWSSRDRFHRCRDHPLRKHENFSHKQNNLLIAAVAWSRLVASAAGKNRVRKHRRRPGCTAGKSERPAERRRRPIVRSTPRPGVRSSASSPRVALGPVAPYRGGLGWFGSIRRTGWSPGEGDGLASPR
mgnify:CR=1 FL=1